MLLLIFQSKLVVHLQVLEYRVPLLKELPRLELQKLAQQVLLPALLVLLH
jgi:hypothetical protein